LLRRVSSIVAEDALIASNTSALSLTELAVSVDSPQRFAGLHFFNPAQLMDLVEVVAAIQTAPETVATLTATAEAVGKKPVSTKDRPGFLLNRLLMPYLNQAVQAYDDEIASAEDIDTAVELGLGYPIGPLRLLDMIGLDVHHHATDAAYAQTRDVHFSPPPLLSRMVDAGYLGKKSGTGLRLSPEDPK
jgi:3-hydroxybutyryl-CoA dehydrogenase